MCLKSNDKIKHLRKAAYPKGIFWHYFFPIYLCYLFISVANTWEKHLRKGKVCLGSWFSSMVGWLQCRNIMEEGQCGAKLLTLWKKGSGGREKESGLGRRGLDNTYPSRPCPHLFLQLDSTYYIFHPLWLISFNYEPLMDNSTDDTTALMICHFWTLLH